MECENAVTAEKLINKIVEGSTFQNILFLYISKFKL